MIVLNIDMPTSCSVCPFVRKKNDKFRCCIPGVGKLEKSPLFLDRPIFCPLHELVEEKPDATGKDEFEFNNGWNACLMRIRTMASPKFQKDMYCDECSNMFSVYSKFKFPPDYVIEKMARSKGWSVGKRCLCPTCRKKQNL